jgi:hypothetical protein
MKAVIKRKAIQSRDELAMLIPQGEPNRFSELGCEPGLNERSTEKI